MASMSEIRLALAAALSDVYGSDVTVSAYPLAAPNFPYIEIVPDSVDYHQSFGSDSAAEQWIFSVQAWVAMTADIAGQILADEFFDGGERSIKSALEQNEELLEQWPNLIVDRAVHVIADLPGRGTTVVGGEWTVRLIA